MEQLDVKKMQVYKILKKKEILHQWKEGNIASARNTLVDRSQKFPGVNDAVFEWYTTASQKNVPVTGPLLQEKALQLASEMGCDEFEASSGWLRHFADHNGLSSAVLFGENAEVSGDTVYEWQKNMTDLCNGYSSKKIFKCDETGLFYRTLPSRSFVQR